MKRQKTQCQADAAPFLCRPRGRRERGGRRRPCSSGCPPTRATPRPRMPRRGCAAGAPAARQRCPRRAHCAGGGFQFSRWGEEGGCKCRRCETHGRLAAFRALWHCVPLDVVVNQEGTDDKACKFGGSELVLAAGRLSTLLCCRLQGRHPCSVVAPEKGEHRLAHAPLWRRVNSRGREGERG